MKTYNWQSITKGKTDKELLEMINNQFYLDLEARFYAWKELNIRNKSFDNKFLKRLKTDCLETLNSMNNFSFREFIIKINPYLILSVGLGTLIEYLASITKHHASSFWLGGTAFFFLGGIISLLISKIRMNNIKKRKKEKEITIKMILGELEGSQLL